MVIKSDDIASLQLQKNEYEKSIIFNTKPFYFKLFFR